MNNYRYLDMIKSEMINLYTLFSFHKKEDYYFSVIDRQGLIFDLFQLPECRNIPLKNNIIPLREEFTDQHSLDLDGFLKEYDLYTCYTGGVGDLFSERAVLSLGAALKDEVRFIPCRLKGQPIPVYAALFLKTMPLVKEFEGMGFAFEEKLSLNAEFAVQDENKGIKFVTSAFVELVKKHDLKIECQ